MMDKQDIIDKLTDKNTKMQEQIEENDIIIEALDTQTQLPT
jgi:hypothetical protein